MAATVLEFRWRRVLSDGSSEVTLYSGSLYYGYVPVGPALAAACRKSSSPYPADDPNDVYFPTMQYRDRPRDGGNVQLCSIEVTKP